MTDFNANPYSAKQLWDRLPGEYDLHRESTYDLVFEGHEFPSSAFDQHATGRSEISVRAPTDSRYQYEYLQTSEVTYMVKKSSVPKKTMEIRVLRYSHGEWSIWRSGSDGVTVKKYANPTLKHETSAPAEQNPSEVQGTSFRVVQEPKRAGKEKGDRLDLRLFRGDQLGSDHPNRQASALEQSPRHLQRQANNQP